MVTDEEDTTGDEAQDSNETTLDKIDNLMWEIVSDISEGKGLLGSTKAQNATNHKKKSIRKASVAKVRSALQRERRNPRRPTQSKAPAGKSSARPNVQSSVKHNDAPIKLKVEPNGDMERKLRRGDASDK